MLSKMKQHFFLFLYCVLSTTRASEALASSSPQRAVAVIGTTGRLGRRIVQELSEKGIPTRCLLRHDVAANTNVPASLDQAESSQQVAAFLQSLPDVTMVPGDITDINSLRRLLQGCDACIAAHGPTAPKPFWKSLILPSVFYPDTLPEHPKQINYQGIQNLIQVMNEESATCKTIVRITGKGESPWSIFSILINALGGLAKAWNYEGEQLLRRNTNLDYIIIRPGVMKERLEMADTNNYRGLRDNGEDMKVTPVSYSQIAELAVQSLDYPNNCRRTTLTAMNVPSGASSYAPLLEQVQPDRRAFPESLFDEHRKAARVGGLAITAVLLLFAQAAIQLIGLLVGRLMG